MVRVIKEILERLVVVDKFEPIVELRNHLAGHDINGRLARPRGGALFVAGRLPIGLGLIIPGCRFDQAQPVQIGEYKDKSGQQFAYPHGCGGGSKSCKRFGAR